MSDERGIGLKGWLAGQKAKKGRSGSQAEAVVLEKNRIAVLPLVNFTPDPADEYFADGMTEELISALANITGLTVISRTSVMQYRNTSKKMLEIGRDLEAGSIIEGSVRKAGNRLRISVQLIDVQEDKHLWAQTYDRELKDVFAVQSDIARNVSEALKVRLLPDEGAQLKKEATVDAEAYSLYLKGRFFWNKRTREFNEKAMECFKSAIELDPNYALAYVGIADCYSVAADWGWGMSGEEAYSKAREATLKALELDDDLGEAHTSLAWNLMMDWKWEAAEKEFKRAIELSPNYASARQWYSGLLILFGRLQEALAEARKACEVDPLAPRILLGLAEVLSELGEYDLAVAQCKKALDIQPDSAFAYALIAANYAEGGKCEEAFNACQKLEAKQLSEGQSRLIFAYVYADCGRGEEARGILQDLLKNFDKEGRYLAGAAATYAKLGDKEEAIALLWKGYETHSPSLATLGSTDFVSLRSDPRFIDLRSKMGLRK